MLMQADILEWCKQYDGPRFHALLTDPPYHLTSITNRFGKDGSSPAKYGTNGAFQRVSRGFMNATWDGLDEQGRGIAFRPETWAALGDLLYPGAFGMAFASTRGYHRMVCAIEDAGFIIHPSIFLWGFGSGFPKATRVRDDERFAGHRYGLQAIKPATEPIIVFQKPYAGRPVDCITSTGAGALNIAGGRIGSAAVRTNGGTKQGTSTYGDYVGLDAPSEERIGRWPANLILGHSDQCTADQCDPSCAVWRLGQQSGESKSKASQRGSVKVFSDDYKGGAGWTGESTERGHDDSGTAARYFFNADYALDKLEAADPLYYCAKASTAEREAGLSDFDATTVDDGRQTPIDNPYLRGETTRRNTHPCIKPLSLTTHLASLLTPPVEYAPRRLLVPFSATGSEVLGGIFAGFDEIVGIEIEKQYVEIAEARIKWWQRMIERTGSSDPRAILEICGKWDKGTQDSIKHWPVGSLFESLEEV